MHLKGSGRVGIGTSSPGGPLHVKSSINKTVIIDSTISGSSLTSLAFQRSGADKWRVIQQSNDDVLLFYNDVGGTNQLALKSNGRVGINDTSPQGMLHVTSDSTTVDALYLESNVDSSSAAPVATFHRHSASPADADYLGQLKFKGENDADQEVVYAKITAKIQDASDGSEDGLIEFANKKAGSNVITARLRSDSLQLLNGTGLTVAGDATITGNLTVNGTQTVLNTATLTVEDKIITVAHGASNASAANESGISVAGANAQILYKSGNDRWETNKEVFSGFGFMIGTTSTDVGLVTNSSGVFDFQAQSDREISFSNVTNGEHVRIDADGNVGIGTNNPESPLDIVTNTSTPSNTLRLQNLNTTNNTGSKVLFQGRDTSGNAVNYGQIVVKHTNTATEKSELQFWHMKNASPNQAITVDEDGHVGIGTDTPLATLHVGSASGSLNTSAELFIPAGDALMRTLKIGHGLSTAPITTDDTSKPITFTTGGTERMRIAADGKVRIGGNLGLNHLLNIQTTSTSGLAQIEFRNTQAGTQIGMPANTNALSFFTGDGERVRIDATGNVGIGDTAPQDYLEINGSGKGLGGLTISNSTHNHAALSFARSSTATARIYLNEPDATHTGQLNFQTSNASGGSPNLVTAMVIDENQNVGIGATSPSVKLDVRTSASAAAAFFTSTGDQVPVSVISQHNSNISTLGFKGLNSSTTYGVRVGAHSNDFVAFTANTERMRIDSSGNVGIGTTSPDSYVHIRNNADATGATLKVADSSNRAITITSPIAQSAAAGRVAVTGTSNSLEIGVRDYPTALKIEGSSGNALFSSSVTVSKTSSGNILQVASLVNPVGASNTGVRLWMSGKNTTDRGTFIDAVAESTSNNHSLRFGTSASASAPVEAMRIDSSQRVGIGTTGPGQPLHVKNSSTHQLRLQGSNSYWNIGTGWSGYYQDYLLFASNTGEKMVIDTAGSVGIGTNSPNTKLHVNKTSSGNFVEAIRIENSGGGVDEGAYINWEIANTSGHGARVGAQREGTGGIALRFDTGEISSAPVERMRINHDGNVGIGETSPLTKLHVTGGTASGTVYNTAIFAGGQNSTAGSGARIWLTGCENDPLARGTVIEGISTNTSNEHSLIFKTSASSSVPTERMRILGNGNVGIATTTPDSRFTVNTTTTGDGIELQSSEVSIAKLSRAVVNSTVVASLDGVTGRPIHIGGVVNEKVILGNAGGYVGIGTTSPSEKLEVNGKIRLGGMRLANNDSGRIGLNRNPDDGSTVISGLQRYQINGPFTGGDYLDFQNYNSSGTYLGSFVLNGGNVGIGTTSPNAKLEIKGASSTNYLQFNNSSDTELFRIDSNFRWAWGTTTPLKDFDIRDTSGNAFFALDRTNARVGIGTTSPIANLEISGASAVLRVGPRYSSGGDRDFVDLIAHSTDSKILSNNERFHIENNNGDIILNPSGNVGIGTDSPFAKLHIKDNTSTVYDATAYQHDLFIEKRNTAGNNQVGTIRFGITGHDGSTTAEASIGVLQTANAHSGNIVFGTRHSGTRAERMRISSDGKVGIGTTSPSEYLEFSRTSGKIGWGMNGNYGVRIGYFDETGGVHGFHVDTKHLGTVTSESRFVVRADSGNVGIGTNNPSALLHVAGEVEGESFKHIQTSIGNVSSTSTTFDSNHAYTFTIPANNTWYTVLTNFRDTSGKMLATVSDSASGDVAEYVFRTTTPAYGVSLFSQLNYTNGGWNTGSFNFQIVSNGSSYDLQCQYSSYYSSSNNATGRIIFYNL